MENKCKDCKYYGRIDSEHGHCLRYPPTGPTTPANGDGHIQVNDFSKVLKATSCGEFIAVPE